MDKKTFICESFIHADVGSSDVETLWSIIEQRANTLEKAEMFSEQRAPSGGYGGAGSKQPYTGEIKDPTAPPTEKQLQALYALFHAKEFEQILSSDPTLMKNDKMKSEVVGKYIDGRYVGKYNKENASKVISYTKDKVDFYKKIKGLMTTLGHSELEVKEELDRFSKTSEKGVWDECLNAIKAKTPSATGKSEPTVSSELTGDDF